MDSASEPAESILEQESFYQKRVASFREKLSGWANFKSGKRIRSNFIQKHHAQQRMRRELLITLAARAYELEKGAPPPNDSNLVPDYLKELLKDPTTGDPLQLTPQ
jgi:hypothetical protein